MEAGEMCSQCCQNAFLKSGITGIMWSNQIKATVRCSCFDLLEALNPPARSALNCYDGSGEQEEKVFLFFFF